jgi:CheY-like chemotaxis protein
VSSKEIGDKFHERVLIVEDDAASRVGMEQLIRSWGFSVEAAGDERWRRSASSARASSSPTW